MHISSYKPLTFQPLRFGTQPEAESGQNYWGNLFRDLSTNPPIEIGIGPPRKVTVESLKAGGGKLSLVRDDNGFTFEISPLFGPYPIKHYEFDNNSKPTIAKKIVAGRFVYAEERNRRLSPENEQGFDIEKPSHQQIAEWVRQIKTGSIAEFE